MYNKTNWKTGDTITADKMNNIEGGIKTNETALTQHIQNEDNPHYPKLWDKSRIDTLYNAGKLTEEECHKIIDKTE